MGTTDSGLDLETKIFSTSGRGRTFFLTSLFIELIDPCRPGVLSEMACLKQLRPSGPLSGVMPESASKSPKENHR